MKATEQCIHLMFKCSFQSVTTQMKATEQYFPVLLFITLYKVAPIFESVDEIMKTCTIEMKAIRLCFPVVLFSLL